MDKTERFTCATCGEEFEVGIDENGEYDSGAYFGTVKIPTEDSEIVSEESSDIEGIGEGTVVEHSEYDELAYWECEDCWADIKKRNNDR